MKVAYCANRKWYYYLSVAIYSLLKHNKVETLYLLLEDNNLVFLDKIQKCFNVNIIIINYKNYLDKYIKKDNNNLLSYSPAAVVRLFLPILLKEDKVIYLDTDTLVLNDISDLWNISLHDNFIAGVKDVGILKQIDYLDINNLPEDYINSGVLVMDLQKLREISFSSKAALMLNKKIYRFPDQDAINYICKGKILFISNIYNSSDACKYSDKMKIIHYVGEKKNWIKDYLYNELWYDIEKEFNEL